MRADRLLSLMMLLQTQGRMTATELATELEVSERTIYRDIEALSYAGVPVYCERGPGGGCALMANYRSSLTGLNTREIQALFALSIPAPIAELGISQPLQAALRKLQAALPQGHKAAQRVHIDWVGWHRTAERLPVLNIIQQAVWQDRNLRFTRQDEYRNQLSEYTLAPYALAAKAGVWYLVGLYKGQWRVFRISRITQAEVLSTSFTRSADFDLAEFWQQWCREYEASHPLFTARVAVTPDLMPILEYYFGDVEIEPMEQTAKSERRIVRLNFESFEAARSYLLGFGRAAEVIEPRALRLSIIDYAEQISLLYRGVVNREANAARAPENAGTT